jgi:hypothetical protein
MSYKISRRRFIEGTAGAIGLAAFANSFEALAQAPTDMRRLLIIQRPVGTVYENWWPQGSGMSYTASRILKKFDVHRERMIGFRGLDLPSAGGVGGGHERGSVLMLTGLRTRELYPGNGGDDPKAEGPSIDQLWVKDSPVLKGPPIASLQLSCDNRADTPEVSTRHMSYSGRHAPMKPYYQPRDAYERVFGTLMPGGMTPGNMDTLAAARAQKQSVLDFALADLARLRLVAPASAREQLDAHEAAIRELEKELDANPTNPSGCGSPEAPEVVNVSTHQDRGAGSYPGDHTTPERDDVKHDRIAQLHFSVIRAAFRCDLTRVVTFQFSPGTNHVSFGDLWPPDPTAFKIHHTTSHDPDSPDMLEFLTRVEEWYADRVVKLLTDLNTDTDMAGGSILDKTLVPYVTEVGARYHNWDNMPFLVFGGASTGIVGGQFWQSSGGRRSTNDLWMACAKVFGLPDFVLGDNDQHTTAITGLFA